jgi:hypothetical protein
MRKLFWIAVFVLGAVLARRAWAQSTAPIQPLATLEAGDFRALAVTTDGTRLMIADAAANQVRVYDISRPADPQLLVALDMEGTPVDLVAGDDFALVLVRTGGDTDLIEVIAPADYDPRALYASVTFIDVPAGAQSVRLSPGGGWGLVIGEGGYTLLELISPSEVNSSAFLDAPSLADALVTNAGALLAIGDDERVQAVSLTGAEAGEALTLVAPARLLALNERGTLAAALLSNNELVIFDPADLNSIGSLSLGARDLAALRFVTVEAGEWLLMADAGSPTITLVDVSDPGDIGEIGSQTLGIAVRALTTWGDLLFVTDGQRIGIYPVG